VTRTALALALAALALVPATAAAKPRVCDPDVIKRELIEAGKLGEEDVALDRVIGVVRCGDITADGDADALFTVASGGTAGDTRYGVLRGRADGSAGALALFRTGYKVGVARRNRRSFEVLQPHYESDDANCCPSSFRLRRFTWTGERFKRGRAKRLETAPRRFYRP
jgi:hypothetical protein